MAITVSSEGVLSCGEPTCSAASRTFGTTPTTRSLFSAHKHAVAFHPPLRRALHVFARGGSAKRAMLSQPTIAKSSSPSSSSSMMGFSAISHEEHLAQMRRNHELSLARARERDALLERGCEERLAGGELELQQPTPLGYTAPPWLQTLLSAVSSPAAGASVLESIQRCSGIDVQRATCGM